MANTIVRARIDEQTKDDGRAGREHAATGTLPRSSVVRDLD